MHYEFLSHAANVHSTSLVNFFFSPSSFFFVFFFREGGGRRGELCIRDPTRGTARRGGVIFFKNVVENAPFKINKYAVGLEFWDKINNNRRKIQEED